MGALPTYQYRKDELTSLQQQPKSPSWLQAYRRNSLTVGQSYIDSLHPDTGIMTRYLELGQLALLLGDCLFVHGGLRSYNMG